MLYYLYLHIQCLSFSSSLIFFLSIFTFSSVSTSETISVAKESSSPALPSSQCCYCYRCHTHLLGILLPLSVHGFWLGSISGVHIALQVLQAVALMLCRMAFQLSHKVVVLQSDNSTAKVNLCNQGGTVYLLLCRLACCILNLADKHGISLIPAYTPIHLNVEGDYH